MLERQQSGKTSQDAPGRQPSDAAVEAVARGMFGEGWEQQPDEAKAVCLRMSRAALVAARPYLMPTAEQIAKELQAHYPRTGMVVASGVTCECGYWNGTESPGRDRPAGAQGRDGLNWHRAQVVLALLSTSGESGGECLASKTLGATPHVCLLDPGHEGDHQWVADREHRQ